MIYVTLEAVFNRRLNSIFFRFFIWLLASWSGSASAADVWFAPQLPRPDVAERLRNHPGDMASFLNTLDSAQQAWDQLFVAPMPAALARSMQTFVLGTGFVLGMPDEDLAKNLAKLVAAHVRLAIGAQSVIATGLQCGHTEGYDEINNIYATISKLKRLRIDISYLYLDEGLWFGHYATGEQECGFNLQQTIKQVALTIEAFAAAYPDIIVGDIEPTVLSDAPDWQTSYRTYVNDLEVLTKKKLAFLDLDIAWESPDWQHGVQMESALARDLGMQVGLIYNGDSDDRSDAAWLAHARNNMAEIEGGLGLVPDRAIISSWNTHPVHSVGVPLNGTLASLITYYERPRMLLALTKDNRQIAGRLLDAGGRPLAGFRVVLEGIKRFAPGLTLPEPMIEGRVPAKAAAALVGLRLNSECLCIGRNDLILGKISYKEDTLRPRHSEVTFFHELRGLAVHPKVGSASVQVTADNKGHAARITSTPDQSLSLNSNDFPVTGGVPFRLSASMMNLRSETVAGGMAIIWKDANGVGLGRDNLKLHADYSPLASTTTNNNGYFSFLGLESQDAGVPARVVAGDQNAYRGAITYITGAR